jgi:hypothetical protein
LEVLESERQEFERQECGNPHGHLIQPTEDYVRQLALISMSDAARQVQTIWNYDRNLGNRVKAVIMKLLIDQQDQGGHKIWSVRSSKENESKESETILKDLPVLSPLQLSRSLSRSQCDERPNFRVEETNPEGLPRSSSIEETQLNQSFSTVIDETESIDTTRQQFDDKTPVQSKQRKRARCYGWSKNKSNYSFQQKKFIDLVFRT